MVKYSLIVVSYKSEDDIVKMVSSLAKAIKNKKDYEIIISDNFNNNKEMETDEAYGIKTIKIHNKKNLGYAQGVNSVIKHCSGEFIIVTNPDIIFKDDDFFKELSTQFKDETIGAISCKLLNEDGTVQTSYRRFPKPIHLIKDFIYMKINPGKEKHHFYNNYQSDKKIIDVDWFSGAFIAVRKTDKIFDNRYFMYFEDVDLCKQLQKKSLRRVVLGQCKIYHKAAYESRNIFSKTFRYHLISTIKYFLKWKTI
jgi:GT2 family glycosyltransferase